MIIQVYKKTQYPDEKPSREFNNISWFEIINNTIYCNRYGEELTIDIDFESESYFIKPNSAGV